MNIYIKTIVLLFLLVAQGCVPAAKTTALDTTATTASAPAITSVSLTSSQATISFTAPVASDNTSTTYTVTSSPGNLTATGTTSPLIISGLTSNTTYTFSIKANTPVVAGSFVPNTYTATVPTAPTLVTATAGSGQASVRFSYPVSDGGSIVTSYTVTSYPGNMSVTGSSSPLVVPALTNGTAYYFNVVANNAVGASAAAYSNVISPSAPGVPNAPPAVTAVSGNGQVSLTIIPPAGNGGAAITSYEVTASPGGIMATGTSTQFIMSGLTNGTAYTFSAKARNSAGLSAASTASASVTPATTPDAPTSPVATAGNTQATITFFAPVVNGGAAVSSYTVTSNPGNKTSMGLTSPLTVTGLTNGTAYTFTVKASNSVGTSVTSIVSNSITPIQSAPTLNIPSPPVSIAATAGNGSATVNVLAPVSNGGAAVTSYLVTASPGGQTGTSTTTQIFITGLTNGTAYTFIAQAQNSVGLSLASAVSNSVTPALPATVSGAPTNAVATAGNTQASVSFSAPVSNGGAAIIEYIVTSNPGGQTGSGLANPIVVPGLINGTSYTFTVTARNSAGISAASAASTSITPAAVPDAPTGVTAVAGDGQASISFIAPYSNGGAAIDSYTVTSNTGRTISGPTSPLIMPNLLNGTAYTFTAFAHNLIGNGIASAPTASVTPSPGVVILDWNGYKGAYSIIMDDFCMATSVELQAAEAIAFARGLTIAFAIVTSYCTPADWTAARAMIAHGSEAVNHSTTHTDPGGWANGTTEISTSTQAILTNTSVKPTFFAYPFDNATAVTAADIASQGYLGARSYVTCTYRDGGFNNISSFNGLTLEYDSVQPVGSATPAKFTLDAYADQAVLKKAWAVRATHGLDAGYAFITTADFTAHFDHLATLRNQGDLWVAPPSTVIRYVNLTKNLTWNLVQNGTGYDIQWNISAANLTKFAVPLRIKILGAWRAFQGGVNLGATVTSAGTIFSANPALGNVQLMP
jgi:hypothetical protein